MPQAEIPQGTTFRVTFKAYSSTDHVTPVTGKALTVLINKNHAGFTNPSAGAATATETPLPSYGWYYYDLSATDTATTGPLIARASAPGIDDSEVVMQVVPAVGGLRSVNVSSLAAGAITNAAFATGAISNTTFVPQAIDSTVFNQTAADKVWTSTTRSLTDKANFSLASASIASTTFAPGAINNAAFATGAISSATFAPNAIDANAFSPAAADTVWSSSASSHNVNVYSVAGVPAATAEGTAQAVTSTTITLDASDRRTPNNLTSWEVEVVSATTGTGQRAYISSYVPSTLTATVTWPTITPVGPVTYNLRAPVTVNRNLDKTGYALATGSIVPSTFTPAAITSAVFAAGAVDANAFNQTAADKVWVSVKRTLTP